MQRTWFNKGHTARQSVISLILVLVVAAICYSISGHLHYRLVALILLLTVSLVAMLFDIIPVLIAAISSALIWNFFFIPPRFTLHIGNTEDVLMFLMYFIVATVNAVLTYKIRQAERKVILQEEKENTLKLYKTILNSLSHELRTPLAAIIGATDNLQSNKTKLSEENKNELLLQISIASLRLNQDVENLLNMSRLESGFLKPKKDWVDINEVIHAIIKRVEENKATQHFSIQISQDIPLFKLDKGMLEQVMYNLVNNAVLHTSHNSEIKVRAQSLDEILMLVIEDNGPGFSEQEIPVAFERSQRLERSGRGGTGLGLSIVKGFIEAMNGAVRLENIEGGGSRFTIELPAETNYLNHLKNE